MHSLTSTHPRPGRDRPPLRRLPQGPQPFGASGPTVTHPAPPPAPGAERTGQTAAPGHSVHRPRPPWPRRAPDPQDGPPGPALRRRCPLGAASSEARRGAGTPHRFFSTARASERACPPLPAPPTPPRGDPRRHGPPHKGSAQFCFPSPLPPRATCPDPREHGSQKFTWRAGPPETGRRSQTPPLRNFVSSTQELFCLPRQWQGTRNLMMG